MPDKAANFTWILRGNPIVHYWFKILLMGIFLGIFIVWGIDGLNINNIFRRDFVVLNLNGSEISSKSHIDFSSNNFSDLNLTKNQSFNSPWISAEFETNYSSNLLSKWSTLTCNNSKTVDITVPMLDGNNNTELSVGDIHEFVFQTLDDSGNPGCLSGDYFETDLSGEKWKARPPVKDMGNGTYTFSLQVHPDFVGDYNLTIILLFRSYDGFKFLPKKSVFDKVLRVIPIKFVESESQLMEIRQCEESDYNKDVWSGRWTRHAKNDSCPISDDGRYRCQEPNFPCQRPWCDGPLGVLESNGWIYSTHCSFKLFSSEQAWNCLNNRWIFWWGDSNHVDTVRNILQFVLDVHDILTVPRIFDQNITNPRNSSQMVRFTSVFNGHPNATGNWQGLNSLINERYRGVLKSYFSENAVPDTIIMNSGLHDGMYWPDLRSSIGGAEYAAAFWAEVVEGVRKRGVVPPEVIYRTTVAAADTHRSMPLNPQKMEAFNGVMLDKLRQYGVLSRVIDDFDMTFPWHYNKRYSDGIHYGRAPLKMKWKDGQIGHQYFVDLMLCYVLINAMCVR